MLKAISGDTGKIFAHDPAARGYNILYRQDQVNHCPPGGRTHG